mmetsp:Transcript_23928/g.52043  ORF Transcript_23928/g.52043 Transcript_23928/m.52043 type:complete len:90 (-) Transcript_23928:230-499(-)
MLMVRDVIWMPLGDNVRGSFSRQWDLLMADCNTYRETRDVKKTCRSKHFRIWRIESARNAAVSRGLLRNEELMLKRRIREGRKCSAYID